jgi:pimeloyl-ACP methyl ester carboxylesterase
VSVPPLDPDRSRPIEIDELAREMRGAATVRDAVLRDGSIADVSAYLVEPAGDRVSGRVLFLHWFAPEEPDGNRTQYVEEAAELASSGVVSLLPQQAFPWESEPTDAERDVGRIADEVRRLRRAIDVLAGDDAAVPVAVVGHDFGGMYGAILASVDDRVRAAVLIAATPRWADWFLPFWGIAGDRHDYLRALAPLDPISHVTANGGKPLLFQFARADYYIARMSAHELHRAAGEPKELEEYEGVDHAMRAQEAVDDRVAFLRAQLRV